MSHGTKTGFPVLLSVMLWLGAIGQARAAEPPKLRGVGIDERLAADPVLAPALTSARQESAGLPLWVRVLVDRRDIERPDGTADFSRLDQRIAAYRAKSVPVVLTLGGLPDSIDGGESWRRFVQSLALHCRALVAGYQIGDGSRDPAASDPVLYAYLLKLSAIQIKSVDAGPLVLQASQPWADPDALARLYREDVAAYLDVVSLTAPGPGDETAYEHARTAIQAIVDRDDPAAMILVSGIVLGEAPSDTPRRVVSGLLADLCGPAVLATLSGPAAAVSTALGAVAALKDLLSGDTTLLDGQAAGLALRIDGREVSATLPHRLVYNISNFSTYLVYWNPDADRRPLEVALRIQTGDVPVVLDALAGTAEKARGFRRDEAARLTRAVVDTAAYPRVVDFNYGATEVFAFRTEATERTLPAVEEIVFRHQQAQAAQDEILKTLLAKAQVELHFRASGLDAGFDVVTENRLFSGADGIEWDELSFSLNGTKWGANRPPFPLLQPEKVLSVPLALRLGKDYRYRLEGVEQVGSYRCFVVWFDPIDETRSLYRGKMWIDSETYARIKTQAVQTNLAAPVVSNEEIQTFEPAAEVDGRRLYLFTNLTSRQILLVAGRNILVEKKVRLSDFRINAPDFSDERLAARTSDHVMYRETDQGIRYYVKRGGERVVSDQLTTTARALVAGTIIEPSFDFPLPVAGINYLNFDFLHRDYQLAVMFGGIYALGNLNRSKLFGRLVDLGIDFFGIAVQVNDQVFDGTGEIRGERLRNRPASAGANLGWQFTGFQKMTGSVQFRYDRYQADPQTAPSFIVPASTMTSGAGLAYEYRRRGYSFVTSYAAYRRGSWHAWGLEGQTERALQSYSKYSASLNKDFLISPVQKIHVTAAYYGGKRLDRLSMYSFGLFDDTRMHGVPSASVRFAELALVRGSYAFDLFGQFRLGLFIDQAFGRNQTNRRDWLPVTGTGAEVSVRGPWKTMMRIGVGRSVLPKMYRGAGSTVVDILLMKPM